MIRNILGDIILNDVEPIDPGCVCGCECCTKIAAAIGANVSYDGGFRYGGFVEGAV